MSTSQSPHKATPSEDRSQSVHEQNTFFSAVRGLKQHEEHIESLVHRIKILENKEISNLKRLQKQERKLSELQRVRTDHQKEIQKYASFKQNIKVQVAEQHSKNKAFKQQKSEHINSVLSDIKSKKKSNFVFMKERQKENDVKVKKLRELDLNYKKEQRDKVAKQEGEMKKSRAFKADLRKDCISKSNHEDIESFERKIQKRQEEIKRLSSLELQLLSSHSQSRMRSEQVRQKYSRFAQQEQLSRLSEMRKKQNERNMHPFVRKIEKRIDKYQLQVAK